MPRRTRLRTERRLEALEAVLRAEPAATETLAPLTNPDQLAGVLAILEMALGWDGLHEWLQQNMGGIMNRLPMDGWPDGTDEQVGDPAPESEDGGWLDGELWDPDHHDLDEEDLIDLDEED